MSRPIGWRGLYVQNAGITFEAFLKSRPALNAAATVEPKEVEKEAGAKCLGKWLVLHARVGYLFY